MAKSSPGWVISRSKSRLCPSVPAPCEITWQFSSIPWPPEHGRRGGLVMTKTITTECLLLAGCYSWLFPCVNLFFPHHQPHQVGTIHLPLAPFTERCLHFTEEETEAQGGQVISLRGLCGKSAWVQIPGKYLFFFF